MDVPAPRRGIFVWNGRSSLLDPEVENKNGSERSERTSILFDAPHLRDRRSQSLPLRYARTSKTIKSLIPLHNRITIKGQWLDYSLLLFVEAGQWSSVAGRVRGSNEQARQINLYPDTLTGKVRPGRHSIKPFAANFIFIHDIRMLLQQE
jgi:hypothetical protein